MKLTDFKNKLCHYRAYKKLFISRLSYYVDFPSPIQVIAVVKTSSEFRGKNIQAQMHFERFVSKELSI